MSALDLPRPVFDAEATAGASLGDLPEWRLEDLYPGMDSPELRADVLTGAGSATATTRSTAA